MIPYNKDLKKRSRSMRPNMTAAERLLWERIRRKQIKGVQFYRQKPLGSYIVDFYCPSGQLIMEVDGVQHQKPEDKKYDAQRDGYLKDLDLTVLRFTN